MVDLVIARPVPDPPFPAGPPAVNDPRPPDRTARPHRSQHRRTNGGVSRRRVGVRRFVVLAMPLLLALGVAACRSTRDNADSTLPPVATSTTISGTAATSSTASTTTSSTTTTTTEPLVFTGAAVMVANASNVNGAARRLTQELAALGFEMREPTNGWGPGNEIAVSHVYFVPGKGEEVARSIARLMGLTAERIPVPAWITGGSETLGDAGVLIMLGKDLAGTFLKDIQPSG